MTFEELFRRAVDRDWRPFPYQVEFSTAAELPSTLRIPTGLGKTAAVVLGWLWRRFDALPEIRRATPRRLVCWLPMRTLVEQTAACAGAWIEKLNLEVKPKVQVLMGGEVADDWDLLPEEPAILIGTQDMLLSRALNRGYAMVNALSSGAAIARLQRAGGRSSLNLNGSNVEAACKRAK